MGMGQRMLQAIQAIYANDTACVQTAGGLTEAFNCNIGVKQGCPLSPNLFGLYLDELEAVLMDVKHDAPLLADIAVPLLLYADDLVLISTSQKGLQALIDRLASFCEGRGLSVNVEKTKVVVFGSRSMLKNSLIFRDMKIEQVVSFRYLGLELHQSGSFKVAATTLLESARKATFGLHSRCAALHINDPKLKCKLFDALVRPILSYGCEVWSMDTGLGEELERWHRKFMRTILKLPSHSVSSMVYGELGRMPLHHQWYKQLLRFWNQLLGTSNELLRAALIENSRMTREALQSGFDHEHRWCSQVEKLIVQYSGPGPLSMYEELDIQHYSKLFHDSFRVAALSSESSMSIYYKMFKQTHKYSEYLSEVKNLHLRAMLTRFRSGCHWLQVNEGRYSDVPKDMRFCPNCPLVVEDEGHFLIKCPAYSCIREKFEHLKLHSYTDVAKLFKECSDYKELAKFMVLCRESRSKLLRS
jgi:hypothetical protein